MGAILTFFNVLAIIIIFGAAALNMEILQFLNTYAITVSLVFWILIILIAYWAGRKNEDDDERYIVYSAPAAVLPLYVYLLAAAAEIDKISGFELLLLPVMTTMCACAALGFGLIPFLLCHKIRNVGFGVVVLTYLAEIFAAYAFYSMGV